MSDSDPKRTSQSSSTRESTPRPAAGDLPTLRMANLATRRFTRHASPVISRPKIATTCSRVTRRRPERKTDFGALSRGVDRDQAPPQAVGITGIVRKPRFAARRAITPGENAVTKKYSSLRRSLLAATAVAFSLPLIAAQATPAAAADEDRHSSVPLPRVR